MTPLPTSSRSFFQARHHLSISHLLSPWLCDQSGSQPLSISTQLLSYQASFLSLLIFQHPFISKASFIIQFIFHELFQLHLFRYQVRLTATTMHLFDIEFDQVWHLSYLVQ